MAYLTPLIVSAIAIFVTYHAWNAALEYRRVKKLMRLHGCQPAPRVAVREPFLGYDLFRRLRDADAAGQRSEAYRDLHRRYGKTFEMKALSAPSVQTAHPANVQAVCTTDFDSFGVEPMRGRIGAPFIDRGIFMVDGDFWRMSRAFVRPTFNRAEIADLEHFETFIQQLLALVPGDGATVDMLPLAKRLFMDQATEFIFGRSMGSLRPEPPADMMEFARAFDRGLMGLAMTLILGPFRWLVYLDPGWIRAYRTVHRFVDARVDEALAQREARRAGTKVASSEERGHGKYVLLHEIAEHTQDRYVLRHQAINLFFPARDTAALAFGNILFYLSRHPHWWDRLREEVVPLRRGGGDVTFETVHNLRTVRAIVAEAIRLHPAASRLGRVALRDTVLPKGGGPDGEAPMLIPKGRVIELDVWCIQRDPDYWGADADAFQPERWAADDRPRWETKWQYEPFLGGIRMCPARNQVLTQLYYLLLRFGQQFARIECRDPEPRYVEQIAMTVESRNGAQIALWRDPEAEW